MTYELTGIGSKIPIFIGTTGNTGSENYKVDGSEFLKFTEWSKLENTTITDGGILKDTQESTIKNNRLYNTLKDFFEESKLITSGDIGVPYIYLIDVGDGATYTSWQTAYKTAKKLLDAQIEVYDGACLKNGKVVISKNGNNDVLLKDFMNEVMVGGQGSATVNEYSIYQCAKDLDLRCVFTTFYDTTKENDITSDTDLLNYSTALTSTEKYSRLGLVEPFLFGKHIARICCTPSNTEPGYYTYRSVSKETFIERTKATMLQLQNAGIIFGRDEHINGKVYPKMNLCVSTAFIPGSNRPADSLFHARFNTDSLLNEVFEACYTQVKANESQTNIAYLQTRINKIVNDRVSAEEMIKWNDKTERGTKLIVSESDEDPYTINVGGYILPTKCTIAIKVNATIQI